MINIKEIAKLAGFSISTVSKVMNGKDSGISEDTKNRILQIIKEYNYTPYSNIKKTDSKSFIIAVLAKKVTGNSALLSGIFSTAKSNGYNILFNYYIDSSEDEKKTLLSFAHQNLDGILWETDRKDARLICNQYLGKNIPLLFLGKRMIDDRETASIGIDMKMLGYELTQMVIDKQHTKIACLVDTGIEDGKRQADFIEGYRSCLFDHSIPADTQYVVEINKAVSLKQMILKDISAVVCIDMKIANMVYHEAQIFNISIPRELSVVSLLDAEVNWNIEPTLTGIADPSFLVGKAATQTIINDIEHIQNPVDDYKKITVLPGKSLETCSKVILPHILVAGSVNMDIILHGSDTLIPGTTTIVRDCISLPGGKGANQAVGVARLGVPVRLLSRIGRDNDGLSIFKELNDAHVEMQHVIIDPVQSTGKAYIFVPDNGDSAITVYLGANAHFDENDIDVHLDAFDNVSFCLLQTEISENTVIHAIAVCKRKGIKTVVKPASIHSCSSALLKDIDYFVPNEHEATRMSPGCETLKERADLFMKMGVKTVIITLGKNGCYLRDSSHSLCFSAAPFTPLDTSGASDAFIATLVCCLYRGEDIVRAIQFASYAGGLSTTKEGCQTGLIDYQSLVKISDTIDECVKVTNL